MLELQALGSLDLRAGDEPIRAVLVRPKEAALLAFLVLDRPGVFHHFNALSAFFWPDLEPDPAREALSRSLEFLAEELPDGILAGLGNGRVGVVLRDVRCDVFAFEDAVAAGQWDRALTLYGGELLDGLVVPGSDGFHRWLEGERERLRRLEGRARGAADSG